MRLLVFMLCFLSAVLHAGEIFSPSEDTCAGISWRQFESLPAFHDANRANVCNTYLLMEKETIIQPRQSP